GPTLPRVGRDGRERRRGGPQPATEDAAHASETYRAPLGRDDHGPVVVSVFPGEFAWESRNDHGSVVIPRGRAAVRSGSRGLKEFDAVAVTVVGVDPPVPRKQVV